MEECDFADVLPGIALEPVWARLKLGLVQEPTLNYLEALFSSS